MLSSKNPQSAQKFVSGLELASPEGLKLPRLAVRPVPLAEVDPNKPSANVVASSTVSFVAGVSKQHREDVLNSTLLADLAASKKFNREDDIENWYQFYGTVLENVGWVVSDFNFDRFQASGSTFTVDKVVLDLIQSIATEDEISVITSTINALKALDDGDGRLVLYETQTHSDNKGNFRANAVSESDSDHIAVMKIGAYHFSCQDRVTRILWFSFPNSRTEFYQGAQTVNLDDGVYAQVRQAIKAKLGNNAVDFVKDLDI